MDGDEHQAALLIKAERIQVVVGRNEPQTRAIGLPRERNRRIEEVRSDSLARLEAVERHDLTCVANDAQGDQTHHRISLPRGEAREFVRSVDDAVRHDDLRTPTLDYQFANAGTVGWEKRADEVIGQEILRFCYARLLKFVLAFETQKVPSTGEIAHLPRWAVPGSAHKPCLATTRGQ